MIKHIVVFKLKETGDERRKAENTQKLKEVLESLKRNILEVRALEVGINQGHSKNAADLVLYSEIDDMQALDRYQGHPEHLKAVEFINQVCSERRVVDYEVRR